MFRRPFRQRRLKRLLLSLYRPDELRALLRDLYDGEGIERYLPENPTAEGLTVAALRVMIRDRMVDAAFFDVLIEDRPQRAAEIEALRGDWVSPSPPGLSPARRIWRWVVGVGALAGLVTFALTRPAAVLPAPITVLYVDPGESLSEVLGTLTALTEGPTAVVLDFPVAAPGSLPGSVRSLPSDPIQDARQTAGPAFDTCVGGEPTSPMALAIWAGEGRSSALGACQSYVPVLEVPEDPCARPWQVIWSRELRDEPSERADPVTGVSRPRCGDVAPTVAGRVVLVAQPGSRSEITIQAGRATKLSHAEAQAALAVSLYNLCYGARP